MSQISFFFCSSHQDNRWRLKFRRLGCLEIPNLKIGSRGAMAHLYPILDWEVMSVQIHQDSTNSQCLEGTEEKWQVASSDEGHLPLSLTHRSIKCPAGHCRTRKSCFMSCRCDARIHGGPVGDWLPCMRISTCKRLDVKYGGLHALISEFSQETQALIISTTQGDTIYKTIVMVIKRQFH